MSAVVDLFNRYIERFDPKHLQDILEQYLIAIESMKFNEGVHHLLEFI
jgi:hypothetical protein